LGNRTFLAEANDGGAVMLYGSLSELAELSHFEAELNYFRVFFGGSPEENCLGRVLGGLCDNLPHSRAWEIRAGWLLLCFLSGIKFAKTASCMSTIR
jgi:hypothetical protein